MIFNKNNTSFKAIFFLFSISLFFGSCGGGEDLNEVPVDQEIDSTSSKVIELGEVRIIIPSPIQTAVLVKDVGAEFQEGILNPSENHTGYSTNFEKAINLGVYGADLGYSAIYEKANVSLKYLKTVSDLADDIGVSSVFSPEIMKRITSNIGNQDSLLGMVSTCYSSLNGFLQENDRVDVCALVMAGGWIESTYFVTQISAAMDSKELINRIGEQKNILGNLIKLIEPFYNDPEYTEFVNELYDVEAAFDNVKLEYNYIKPSVNAEDQTTVVNSTSNVVISDEDIKAISGKIEALRELITQ